MKHVNQLLCGLLFSFSLIAGSVPAMADENVIQTKAAAEGNVVTVEVTAEDKVELTSGRVVVSYDKEVLTLKTVETSDTWEAEDVNTEKEDGVSYAFADSCGNSEGGEVMTLTFLAKEAGNGKTTTIKTEVKELYAKDEALEQAGSSSEVTVTPAWEEEKEDNTENGTTDNKSDDTTEATETTESGVTDEPQGSSATASASQSLNDVLEQRIAEAADGTIITTTVGASEQVISEQVFTDLMGKDVTMEFRLDNGVVWKVNGKNIKTPKEIDLGVTVNSAAIPQTVLENIVDDAIRYEVQFSLDFDGDLGGTFELSIPVGAKGTGFFGNLYYFNTAKNVLEFMQTDKVDENGMVTYSFTHASDYVVAVSETDGARVNTVKTGDQTSVAGYVLLLCAAAVLVAFAVKRRRKVR